MFIQRSLGRPALALTMWLGQLTIINGVTVQTQVQLKVKMCLRELDGVGLDEKK